MARNSARNWMGLGFMVVGVGSGGLVVVRVRFGGGGGEGFGCVGRGGLGRGVFFGVLGGFFEGSGSGVGEVVAVPAGHVFAGACVVGD